MLFAFRISVIIFAFILFGRGMFWLAVFFSSRFADEVISLMARQAELRALRNSGMNSLEDWTFINNWHAKNLEGTLEALKELGSK